jgi:hypothetical protein
MRGQAGSLPGCVRSDSLPKPSVARSVLLSALGGTTRQRPCNPIHAMLLILTWNAYAHLCMRMGQKNGSSRLAGRNMVIIFTCHDTVVSHQVEDLKSTTHTQCSSSIRLHHALTECEHHTVPAHTLCTAVHTVHVAVA